MSFVLRLRIAVTRVREVRARRATWAWVSPLRWTTSAILELRSLRRAISAPSAGVRPKALASSAAGRAMMALDFFIWRFRKALDFRFYLATGAEISKSLNQAFFFR
jgi:hypothetical protein